ncbi:MAG: alkaline phosphatase [Planctomycetota bacterium]
MTPPTAASRRDFLFAAAGGLASAGLAGCARGEQVGSRVGAAALSPTNERVKNVVFVVADGMDHASVMLADLVSRRRDGRASPFVSLRADERTTVGQCMTFARDSIVTDSAAAGSAFGIGEHVDNRSINFVDDREPTPILVRARNAGLATGLVTTTRLTHATPAAMACNVPSRNLEDAIAEQLLDRRVDVLLGGGAKHFPDGLLAKHPDLTLVRNANELASASSGRLLGLFNDSHLRYSLDRLDAEPSLSMMTRAALDRLSASGRGFIMQVEAGRVDHAGHANDAAGLVHDMLEFNEVVRAAAEFTDSRDDTLLIVTTDHGTGGPQLTKYMEPGATGIDRIASARRSFEWIDEELGGLRAALDNPGRVREVMEYAAGFDPGMERVDWLVSTIRERERGDGFDEATSPTALLGSVFANGHAVAFTSVNHNADYVDVLARGPGAERLGRFIDNVDIHTMMCEGLGIPTA